MNNSKIFRASIALQICFFLLACPALAHSIHIFGWTTDSELHAYSYITRDKPLLEGEVTVKSAAGKELGKGRPNEDGLFSMPLAGLQGEKNLVLIIETADGHRAEFKLDLQ